MSHDNFHIAVLAGDGIGPEMMAPALDVLRRVETKTAGLNFGFAEAPAGAGYYRETGTALPEETIKLCLAAERFSSARVGCLRSGIRTEPKSRLRWSSALFSIFMPACGQRD